jgi:protein MpaA
MGHFQFGKTSSGLPIIGYKFGRSGPETLILGGVHGNEPEGVIAAFGLVEQFLAGFTYKLQATIVPQFNLDGVMTQSRRNARGVDLNRNLPTKDWTREVKEEKYFPGYEPNSEPENQALVSWISQNKPKFVLSLHSWKPLLNVNGACLPEAQVLAKYTGYKIDDDIGYPTPGCLGTYCGLERNIPTLTYEIERGITHKPILEIHVPAILEALKITEGRF